MFFKRLEIVIIFYAGGDTCCFFWNRKRSLMAEPGGANLQGSASRRGRKVTAVDLHRLLFAKQQRKDEFHCVAVLK